MTWRTVVVSRRAKLDLKLNYLVVREDETTRIHLSEISTLMIESTAVSLTAALLCELMKRKIKVVFCDEKRNPSSELIPYYGSHDASAKVKQQIFWKEQIKGAVWTRIVEEKIRKQADLLDRLGCNESTLLRRYISELRYRDESNREGHAAKVYFNALFGMGFTRTAENVRNAALNYGYAILLSAFNREIAACGYITQLGLFHENQFNLFNLASDLMEPFRPLVDETVFHMEVKEFGHKQKMMVLDVLNKDVEIDHKKHYVNNAVRIYCKSVFDSLNEEDISLIRFYNEL